MKKIYKNTTKRFCYYFLLLAVALNSPANYAAEEEIAGRVVAVTGQVSAQSATGNSRPLSRRSEIFVGDTVVTQADAFAQIRMTDGAIVSLKESTQFEIVAYSYEEDAQNDVISMRLIEGGFRTITGRIGEQNRDAYNVITEFSNIGIRGTDHEAVIDGFLFVGVYDGGTQLDNNGGTLDLGVGANFDFGRAIDNTIPPEGLIFPPSQLGAIPVLALADLEQSEGTEDSDEDVADGDQDGAGGDQDGANADSNNDGTASTAPR